jgi:2-phosphoglycerate kinase
LKTIVVNEQEDLRTPFLRGILIRSLLDTGLLFEDAFALATRVRDALSGTPEVSTHDLREHVTRMLERDGQEEALEAYRSRMVAPARIVVTTPGETATAFSRGRHERYLQASGLKQEKSEQTTALIYDQLLAAGVNSISTDQLGFLTWLCLRQELSRKASDRYLVWSQFQRSGRPLLLLICGAVGTGKSTVATEVAHLLDIVRIQSTDMLREVMRMMLPERLVPVLHTSSFNAWKALPIEDKEERGREQLIADGYRSQVALLEVACEAVMQRAVEESVPVIIEGVHVHPELLQRVSPDSGAIAVHTTLAVLRSKDLKARLRGRGVLAPQRRAKRYLGKFDAIWSLQSFLLSEADRCETAIITNQDKDKTVQQVILQVNAELAKHFKGRPDEVFGESAQAMMQRADRSSWRELVGLAAD